MDEPAPTGTSKASSKNRDGVYQKLDTPLLPSSQIADRFLSQDHLHMEHRHHSSHQAESPSFAHTTAWLAGGFISHESLYRILNQIYFQGLPNHHGRSGVNGIFRYLQARADGSLPFVCAELSLHRAGLISPSLDKVRPWHIVQSTTGGGRGNRGRTSLLARAKLRFREPEKNAYQSFRKFSRFSGRPRRMHLRGVRY